MKVLFLSTHINTGGISSYLMTLTNGYIKRGHKVFIASSGGNLEEEFKSIGAKLINLNIRTKSELDPRIYLALKPLADYIKKNDIHIIHSHTRITQVMGRLLQSMTGLTYVSTCHGYFTRRLSRRFAPCWGEKTVAISHAVYKHLRDDFKVPTDNIALIESGVDLHKYAKFDQKTKIESKKRLNLKDEMVIGVIARLSDVKGLDVLVRAMQQILKELPNAKLVMVGGGREKENLENLIAKLKLEDNVILAPIVKNTTQCLSAFDVFVMPSRQEGLGLSVMEAQACALPVVASRVGGLPTLIDDGKTGLLVESENEEQLAKAIIKLLNDKALAKKLGQAAREFINDRFSSDSMVEKTLNLYARLMV